MRGYRAPLIMLAAGLLLGPTVGRAQQPPPSSKSAAQKPTGSKPAASSDVVVTVAYTGKAKVDDTHEIWVFLFPDSNISAGSQPLAVQAVKKSGGTATFKAVARDPVYIAVAYDEKGDYDGTAGPPPPGTPIAMHGKDGVMIAVKPGPSAKVKMSFDDSRRMGS